MPFSEITVDRLLLAGAMQERDAWFNVKAITKLGHDLQLPVCAKGLESRRMVELARACNLDTARPGRAMDVKSAVGKYGFVFLVVARHAEFRHVK